MRLSAASLAFVALLAASLAGKAVAMMPRTTAAADETEAVTSLLRERGLAVSLPDGTGAPAWIIGSHGACRVRVADVPPAGWARRIIAEQAEGETLRYAFGGRFYDEQPVLRTRLENYRRRLFRYVGLPVAALEIRAVTISHDCPAGTIAPEDAARLSQ